MGKNCWKTVRVKKEQIKFGSPLSQPRMPATWEEKVSYQDPDLDMPMTTWWCLWRRMLCIGQLCRGGLVFWQDVPATLILWVLGGYWLPPTPGLAGDVKGVFFPQVNCWEHRNHHFPNQFQTLSLAADWMVPTLRPLLFPNPNRLTLAQFPPSPRQEHSKFCA